MMHTQAIHKPRLPFAVSREAEFIQRQRLILPNFSHSEPRRTRLASELIGPSCVRCVATISELVRYCGGALHHGWRPYPA